MTTRTTLITLCLVGLSGCEFYAHFFDWLDNASLVCNDIQSAAEACWANANDEEAESECESLEFDAADCTWELNGEATAETAKDGECATLEEYAEACWELAETAEDEAFCEELVLDLADCLAGDPGEDTGLDA